VSRIENQLQAAGIKIVSSEPMRICLERGLFVRLEPPLMHLFRDERCGNAFIVTTESVSALVIAVKRALKQ
jgi:hypothetical protein